MSLRTIAPIMRAGPKVETLYLPGARWRVPAGGPVGVVPMSWTLIFRHRSQAGLFGVAGQTIGYLLAAGNAVASGGFGYRGVVNGPDSAIEPFAIDGAGSTRVGPNANLTPADFGRCVTVVGTIDGTLIRHYKNGTEVGAGAACVGYTPKAVGLDFVIGALSAGTLPNNWAGILAVMLCEGTLLSAAQVSAWHAAANDDVITGRSSITTPPGATRYWDAEDANEVANTWLDRIGGLVLTLATATTPVGRRTVFGRFT